MSKIQLQIIRGVGLTLALVLVLFILAASNANAETGLSVGNAVKHAVQGTITHNLSSYNDTLKHVRQLVIVPEPGTNALMVAGGLVGLVAWRLRKRSHRNSVSS